MSDIQITELEQVIDKIYAACLNKESYSSHAAAGTLNTYYQQLLTKAVAEVSTLPFSRAAHGLDPLESHDDVTDTFVEIARMLGLTFGKHSKQVEHDLMAVIETFPSHDFRVACVLRTHNKLH